MKKTIERWAVIDYTLEYIDIFSNEETANKAAKELNDNLRSIYIVRILKIEVELPEHQFELTKIDLAKAWDNNVTYTDCKTSN